MNRNASDDVTEFRRKLGSVIDLCSAVLAYQTKVGHHSPDVMRPKSTTECLPPVVSCGCLIFGTDYMLPWELTAFDIIS